MSAPAEESQRPQPRPRAAYRTFRTISTRWADNDAYGHVNNVVYYAWFDTAVNGWLMEQGLLEPQASETIGLVVQTGCNYFSPLSFPEQVDAGLRVAHVGGSSARYEIGMFAQGAAETAAHGHFVHVYVDSRTRRPVPLSERLRTALKTLA